MASSSDELNFFAVVEALCFYRCRFLENSDFFLHTFNSLRESQGKLEMKLLESQLAELAENHKKRTLRLQKRIYLFDLHLKILFKMVEKQRLRES